MSNGNEIDVRELRPVMRIFDAVEARFGPTVDLQADYYWTLDLRRSFDPHAEQSSGITAGQLADDVQAVRQVLTRSDEPVVWHDLSHLVGVLKRIAALDLPDVAAP